MNSDDIIKSNVYTQTAKLIRGVTQRGHSSQAECFAYWVPLEAPPRAVRALQLTCSISLLLHLAHE